MLVLNGAVTWDYGNRVVSVPAGHISFSWPWEWHGASGEWLPSSELYWVTLPVILGREKPGQKVAFHPKLGMAKTEGAGLIQDLRGLPQPVFSASAIVRQIFPKVVDSLSATDFKPTFTSRALLLAMLAEIQAQIRRHPGACAASALSNPSDVRSRVLGLLGMIKEHYDESWPLERMTATSRVARTHLTRWVKELTGDTPVQYLNRKRIERAMGLMQRAEMPVTEIAFACGFQSSQYFATVFKAFTGKSPTNWRDAGSSSSRGRT